MTAPAKDAAGDVGADSPDRQEERPEERGRDRSPQAGEFPARAVVETADVAEVAVCHFRSPLFGMRT